MRQRGVMKRPLLIAVLLLIALAAAPACAVKERVKPLFQRVEVSQPVSPARGGQVTTGGRYYLLYYLPAETYNDDFSNDLPL
jgi:hypothetical protein